MISPINYAIPSVKEDHVKAVFLYNFANFFNWPKNIFNSSNDPFHICILGQNPFRLALDVTAENKKVKTHPIVVKQLNKTIDTASCHILFVSDTEQDHLQEVFSFVKNYPILTVSDIEDFTKQGGMVKFFKHDNKIRFAINPCIVERAGLKADANLLKLAKIVKACWDK